MARIEADFEDACDFHLIGVSSHVGPHRLGWDLNRTFGWDLGHFLDWKVDQKEGHSFHTIYRHFDEPTCSKVYFICNRTPSGVFAPGVAQLDYLLTLPIDSFMLEPMLLALRALTSVSVAAEIDPMGSGALDLLAILDVTETEQANSLQTER
ncbi:MAG: hypothetical protein ACO3YQ_05365 [Flavobacteriales bacterium]|jgi:hypothetical protein